MNASPARALAAALSGLALASMCAAPATAAQPVPIPASPTWSFSASPAPHTLTPNTAASQSVLVCTLNVQNAHNSSHVGGTVNVVSTIACNASTDSLKLQVTLYKIVCDPGCYDAPYGKTGSSTKYFSASIQANSAAACSPGQYFGTAFGSIVAEPGYVPPSGSVEGSGPTSTISC